MELAKAQREHRASPVVATPNDENFLQDLNDLSLMLHRMLSQPLMTIPSDTSVEELQSQLKTCADCVHIFSNLTNHIRQRGEIIGATRGLTHGEKRAISGVAGQMKTLNQGIDKIARYISALLHACHATPKWVN